MSPSITNRAQNIRAFGRGGRCDDAIDLSKRCEIDATTRCGLPEVHQPAPLATLASGMFVQADGL